jgi:hypothetical protein
MPQQLNGYQPLWCTSLQSVAGQYDVYPVCILYHNPAIKTPGDWANTTSIAYGACLTYRAVNADLTVPPQVFQYTDNVVVSRAACRLHSCG